MIAVVLESNIEEKVKTNVEQQPKQQNNELVYLVKALYEKFHITDETVEIVDKVPRYLVPGIIKNKNVGMSHLIHQLIEDFRYGKILHISKLYTKNPLNYLYPSDPHSYRRGEFRKC